MRAFCLIISCCVCAGAQTGYTYDVSGRRVETGRLDGGTYLVETVPSLNGGRVPLERVEERVVEQDSSRRVVERLIRRYDQNGNPGEAEKVRVEERKNPDGSMVTESLTWRADLNGRFQLAERAHGEIRPAGTEMRSNISIERPDLNGAFETVEKRVSTERKTGTGVHQETITWRRDLEGQFGETAREVTDRAERNGLTTESTARYDNSRSDRLELASRTVSRTVKNADGSQRTELDLFRVVVPGRPVASRPQLIEQQVVETHPGGAGATVESVSVRRPPPDSSKPTGPYQKIAERICTGGCK